MVATENGKQTRRDFCRSHSLLTSSNNGHFSRPSRFCGNGVSHLCLWLCQSIVVEGGYGGTANCYESRGHSPPKSVNVFEIEDHCRRTASFEDKMRF